MEQLHNRDSVRHGIFCAFLVGLLVLVARPFAEIGCIDDWAYIRSAQAFAATGHFLYNGWATATLGWMVPWCGLFLKLFGFSFTKARLALLPVDLGGTFLFCRILQNFGISSRNAVFGTLLLYLSPLCFPLIFTCMTDIPALACILLCIYLCQKAVQARTPGATMAWLALAAISNVAGGSVRQIAWLGALAVVPATAFFLRRRRYVLVSGALLFLLSFASILALMHWFKVQPYSVPESQFAARITPGTLVYGASEALRLVLCLAFLLLPVTLAWTAFLLHRGFGPRLRVGLVGAVSAVVLVWPRDGGRASWLIPFGGHILSTLGMSNWPAETAGPTVVVLNLGTKLALTVLAIMAGYLVVESLLASKEFRGGTASPHETALPDNTASANTLHTWRAAAWLLGPYTLAYACLLAPRALFFTVVDRYLVGLLPVAIAVLLLLLQKRTHAQTHRTTAVSTAISAVALALFAAYSVATTHDWFSLDRARIASAAELTSAGIPRTSFRAGYEFDGWTELEARGYVVIPPGNAMLQDDSSQNGVDPACKDFFKALSPSIHARYIVTSQMLPCFSASPFAPVGYATWLPPYHRQLFIQSSVAQP